MTFPITAKCVTLEAGYPAQSAMARKHLQVGQKYTIRQMIVGQSETHLEFYEIRGQWNSVFFDAVIDDPSGEEPE